MANLIRIPTPLRNLTGNAPEVTVDATNVGEALNALEEQHNGIKARICDEEGNVRRFVNVFVTTRTSASSTTSTRRSRMATRFPSSPPSPADGVWLLFRS